MPIELSTFENEIKRITTLMILPWHQYLLAILFIVGGIFHFTKPHIYKKIMPPYLPAHNTLILLSGILEMMAGLVIINPETQTAGAWLIIALLVLFIPVHVYMLQNKEASLKVPKWVLVLRIPLQFALMFWAYQYI